MRAFVLCSGRCGSMTLAKACSHITNYTAGHETRSKRYYGRFDYPDNHIEVDNRLSWMTGTLERVYGDAPVYVYLKRDFTSVVDSYKRRSNIPAGLVPAFAHGLIQRPRKKDLDYEKPTRLMLDVIQDNIRAFIDTKSKVVTIDIDIPHSGFERLWSLLGAEGDKEAALAEFDTRHNARKVRK